jgi:nucleoside-diphosphate-sugar epimerase
MNYTVAITGGAGYIGSSLADKLSDSFSITLLDVRPPNGPLPKNVSFQLCDITKYDQVKKAVENVNLVIHTAIIQIPTINEQKRLGYEVNITGTQNVCRAVYESERVKGLILSGSWHTIGEKELSGVINEEFGFRPDKVEDRARLYALSKMAQESIVRFYDEMTEKVFGIIRMGTVLGEGMPEKTAANIFIEKGLGGKPLTPFKQSMYRPMLYVDINDICEAYKKFAIKILNNDIVKNGNSVAHIVNVYYQDPVTILELAEITKEAFIKYSNGKITPKIDIIDNGQPSVFNKEDKNQIKVDAKKALDFLGIEKLKSPRESMEEMVKSKLKDPLH